MSKWIRKTPVVPLHDVPVSQPESALGTAHHCSPPQDVDAGPRSVWECDCGQRWRIAMPFWRPLGAPDSTRTPATLPGWVLELRDPSSR